MLLTYLFIYLVVTRYTRNLPASWAFLALCILELEAGTGQTHVNMWFSMVQLSLWYTFQQFRASIFAVNRLTDNDKNKQKIIDRKYSSTVRSNQPDN